MIGNSDLVLALIGPHWQHERLADDGDIVRSELMSARTAGKRVVPLVHSGAMMPTVTDLPTELAWLATTNAAQFTDPFVFDKEVDALVTKLTGVTPRFQALRDQAVDLYIAKDLQGLTDAVDEIWSIQSNAPTPAAADCYRLLALSMTRAGDEVKRNLWLSRSISAAYISGGAHVLGAALLPLFFQLLSVHDYVGARGVLVEVQRLTDSRDLAQIPTYLTMVRVFLEKMAFTYFLEGDYSVARDYYQQAFALVDNSDNRGREKARAAGALCDYFLGEVAVAIAETESVIARAVAEGWKDLADLAVQNLATMKVRGETFLPYEVT